MRIWCFYCFTYDEEEENGGGVSGRLKQLSVTAMDNNNDFVDFDLNERELGLAGGSITVTEDQRWPLCEEMLATEEDGEAKGTELEQFWSSEIRSHHLVQGESSNTAAAVAEDCTMEEADHDSYHKRAKVYSGLAGNMSILGECNMLRSVTVNEAILENGAQEIHLSHDLLRELKITKCRVMRLSIRCPQLRSLSLKRSYMSQAMLNCPLLKLLDIASCHTLLDAAIRSAAISCRQLESLDVSNRSGVSDETLRS